MSGDVQPRKRKDKKRKKDELGVEEGPRGTAAALGEGDVFMHSHNEHGTGGHWCAKIIFFSLLAVLVTLIGLIILENRGLSELEANSVESRYSGVLEGWLEDAPDDDHHDEHTLELKHHDNEEADHDDHSPEIDHDEDEDDEREGDDHDDDDDEDDEHEDDEEADEHDDDDEDEDHEQDDDDDDQEVDDHDDDEHKEDELDDDEAGDHDQQDDGNSEEQDLDKSNEDDDNEEHAYGKYDESDEDKTYDANDDDDNDDLQRIDENDTAQDDDNDEEQNEKTNGSIENDDEDNSEENEEDDNETRENEEEEEHEEEVEDLAVEVERLEKEVSDEDALSEELPAAEAEEDDNSEESSSELAPEDVGDVGDLEDEVPEDDEFLEPDDIVEAIVVPKGKPFIEVEEPSTIKPADTLADEEEYEKQQEELRREQEQASHMWLKLVVGGALLLATHAVVRRATAPRDDTAASDEHASREETPVIDRRMTLISEEEAAAAIPIEVVEEIEPILEETLHEKVSAVLKSVATHKEESEDEEVEEEENEVIIDTKDVPAKELAKDKELYSDDEEAEEEEEEEIVKKVVNEPPKQSAPVQKTVAPEADDDVPDDVEIIDEEQIEEELEEEDNEEEEISDVDDAELLSRLEAKYGRLPEPERPGQKHKDGGNSIEDDWPGEPSEQYWRQQLDQAEDELRQGEWSAASQRAGAKRLKGSARARWVLARALDVEAEARRDNRLLTKAITSYLDVLKMNERLTDKRLLEVAYRTLDRIRFRGNYLSAEPVYRLLIRRFPDVVDYHNNLTVSFLMANRVDLAEQVIKETLQKWPEDRFALAHHGFVLKTKHNRVEEAVEAFQKALAGDIGPAIEPRFYYHLGDSLLLLGRYSEAHEVHKRGAALGHFLSPAQRSLYNVERLKSQPWWNIEQTPYSKLARELEKSWKEILKEGETAKALYEKEKEGLKERGEWSQLDLFVRGQEVPNRCKRAPVTCSIVRSEVAAAGCRRGQVKFSAMEAGTHVRPHVGPTNCRLRMHLGLSNTKDTYIRVDQETRQWQVGKTLMFDDSFEHEVWHNGTGTRLVLIVDVWHPALSPAERRALPPI